MSKMVKIAAFWKQTAKDGNWYLSGTFGDASVVIFKNKYKTKDNHPDMIMYVSEKKKKEPEGEDDFASEDPISEDPISEAPRSEDKPF